MERRLLARLCLGGTPATEHWCPWCYENRRGRATHKGHAHYYPRVPRRITYEDFAVKRPSQASRPKKGEFECPDAAFQSNYPELARFLCDEYFDDGKPRKRGTLKIWMDDVGVHLYLNDPDSKMGAFTTAEGLTEALMGAEAALGGGTISWRRSKY